MPFIVDIGPGRGFTVTRLLLMLVGIVVGLVLLALAILLLPLVLIAYFVFRVRLKRMWRKYQDDRAKRPPKGTVIEGEFRETKP